jgi:hypothetical protein
MNSEGSTTAGSGVIQSGARITERDVLTQRYDNARSGANLIETRLNSANVREGRFGRLAFRIVDGNVQAQPLLVSKAKIRGRVNAPNVVIVATEHNSVYAFDADDTRQSSLSALLWRASLEPAAETPESANTLVDGPSCLETEAGIDSTPVIMLTRQTPPKEGVVFVVSKSGRGNTIIYKLVALNLFDGSVISDVVISGEFEDGGLLRTGTGRRTGIRFNPLIQSNRAALLLQNNSLYIAFGGYCASRRYQGWLFAYDVSNPKVPRRLDVFCSTPKGNGAGIDMGGHGLVGDENENVYFVTGPGVSSGGASFSNSVIRIKLVAGKLQVQDWFSPQNRDTLNRLNVDLGSAGATLVPGSHLLLAGSGEGRIYLIDRNDMGKGDKLPVGSLQVTHPPLVVSGEARVVHWGIRGTPVIWQRRGELLIYVAGEEDFLKQYRLVETDVQGSVGLRFLSDLPVRISRDHAPYPNSPIGLFDDPSRGNAWGPGGLVTVSADMEAEGTGVVWMTMPYAEDGNQRIVRGVFVAFDAADVSKGHIWSSEDGDRLGLFSRFSPPTVANGKVYVATCQQESVQPDGKRVKVESGERAALSIYGLR